MSGSIRSWLEVGGVVALVGGLALVSVQIQQSTEITRIQLKVSHYDSWRSLDSTLQSEEFAKVLAKSIEQPQDLTLAEFFELEAYYLSVFGQLEAAASLVESGYSEHSLEGVIVNNAEIYFGNAFAKAWLIRTTGKWDNLQEWVQVLLAATKKVDSGSKEAKYRGVLQDIE